MIAISVSVPYPPSPLHEPTIDEGVLRPTHVEIDLSRITGNYRSIQDHVGDAKVMAVLKANAYGHGLVPVAKTLEAAGAHMIGLAYLEEGIRLRRAGVSVPILILGGILGRQIPSYLAYDLTLTASSVDKLLAIDDAAAQAGVRAKVHLKIDTGMERIGVHWYSATPLLEASLTCKNVDVQGIFSHFANADALDLTHARMQLERFLAVTQFYADRGLKTPMRHIANSGALLQMPEARLDLVRPGILLFGVHPSPDVRRSIRVWPALSWKSRVVSFKVVQPGHHVGYGGTWTSDKLTRLVTVPVGYGDGYMRAMSGQAQVMIHGKRYPVVGRVCMDQVVVDIGWDSAHNGDEVVLLGGESEPICAEEMANWANTISYEVLTNINTRVPRVYV